MAGMLWYCGFMGYSYYEIDGMKRGYGVSCKCHKRGCKERIDRGLAYLCYGCTQYFCSKHLFYSDVKHDCFAGSNSQVCEKCLNEVWSKNTEITASVVRRNGTTQPPRQSEHTTRRCIMTSSMSTTCAETAIMHGIESTPRHHTAERPVTAPLRNTIKTTQTRLRSGRRIGKRYEWRKRYFTRRSGIHPRGRCACNILYACLP